MPSANGSQFVSALMCEHSLMGTNVNMKSHWPKSYEKQERVP